MMAGEPVATFFRWWRRLEDARRQATAGAECGYGKQLGCPLLSPTYNLRVWCRENEKLGEILLEEWDDPKLDW